MAIEGNGRDDGDRVGSLDVGPMGVRVIIDDDPLDAAFRLAEENGGEVIVDAEDARTAFAARAEAARLAPVVLEEDELASLLAKANQSTAPTGGTSVTEEAVSELRELADAIGRTDRIRVRTEVEFTDALNRRLSASSGVAIHPETIKQAAHAVTGAETEVADIDAALTELGDRPRPEQVVLDSADVEHDMFDDEHLEHQRRNRAFAMSAIPFFGGLGVILAGVLGSIVIAIALTAVGIVLAVVLMFKSRGRHDDRDEREASALLAAATSNAERTSEASARGRLAEDDWLARKAQLETARERAEEKARSARRHWETLAGAESDPYDLDNVLQLHDPQFLITGAATQTSPTVRTVNAVHRKALARWKVAWAALGYDTPPPIEEMDDHLAKLNDSESNSEARAEAEQAGERLKEAEAWARAGETIDRPMILVEPYTWVEEEELSALLRTLPAGAEVILVTPPHS